MTNMNITVKAVDGGATKLKNAISQTVEVLLLNKAKRTTKYISEKLVVSAQRKSWGNKIDGRDRTTEIVMKIGAPNYLEREFIKKAKKAGEPFPIKKVQIKFFPAK
jgi:hypothetical protein